MKFKCPVCGKEVNLEPRLEGEPIGGLYEVIVQHERHFVKVYIDKSGFIRRVFPIEHLVIIDPPQYTIYIYEDRAEIIDHTGNIYITDSDYLLSVVKKIIK
ncbi:conserved hypothetical protein [Pyrobaculum islandicum DSM 4184]|uniref:Uncharacterized protein n=1 Tax=Pyrobaculum islandicum (strain DSM 4184 / JCM 9189 / GEO3) TaxID=384616 RepID=A1RRJ0_PYRIL|nr:hypothetical protein [Pyrobaculum islandicum]ABL87572.1 conserved hypothetical protein [Pyrobaculum islandicum DSM 4184]